MNIYISFGWSHPYQEVPALPTAGTSLTSPLWALKLTDHLVLSLCFNQGSVRLWKQNNRSVRWEIYVLAEQSRAEQSTGSCSKPEKDKSVLRNHPLVWPPPPPTHPQKKCPLSLWWKIQHKVYAFYRRATLAFGGGSDPCVWKTWKTEAFVVSLFPVHDILYIIMGFSARHELTVFVCVCVCVCEDNGGDCSSFDKRSCEYGFTSQGCVLCCISSRAGAWLH